jgi:Tfp pilus assembly protein PilO
MTSEADTLAEYNGWHLNRSVPISIIIVLMVQLAGGLWFAFQLRSDIDTNSRDIVRIERSVETITLASQQQAVQLGRIEEQVSGMRSDMSALRSDFTRFFEIMDRTGR